MEITHDKCGDCNVNLNSIFTDKKKINYRNKNKMIGVLYTIAKILLENYDEKDYIININNNKI